MTSRRRALASAEPTVSPLRFVSPESSTILGASYHPDTERLLVTFRSNGSTYAGGPCSRELWDAFEASESKGRFYQTHIRGHIEMVKQG